jgi:hypothetical protein
MIPPEVQKLLLSLLGAHRSKMREVWRRADRADKALAWSEIEESASAWEWVMSQPTQDAAGV